MKFVVRKAYMVRTRPDPLHVSGYYSPEEGEEVLFDTLKDCLEKLNTQESRGGLTRNMFTTGDRVVLKDVPISTLKAVLQYHNANIFNHNLKIVLSRKMEHNEYKDLVMESLAKSCK